MQHMHMIGLGILWAVVVAAMAVGGVCLLHLILPTSWHFLGEDQLSRLNTIAVTSIVSVLLTFFVQQAVSAQA